MAKMGHSRCFSTYDDDFEFDDAYFRQFYKPLSNLPTPPPSSKNSSATQSPRITAEDVESISQEFLGPAAHLARMLPPGASFMTPSIPIVQGILARADLPMDIIALAVCVLDSLNSRFSRSWRISFPLGKQHELGPKRHTLPSGIVQAVHIDNIFPEVIILAALIIADKFVEDLQETTQYYCSSWGRNQWTCDQINFTERCIMENLGYRILPLWEEKLIKQARHDIEMARRELLDAENEMGDESKMAKHVKSMSSGHAVMGLGLQLTPVETEMATPFSHVQELDRETREAFSNSTTLTRDYLHMPPTTGPQ
ncbi:uncharacterized protein GGS22DRAFT_68882 [Annulohypoxylon maeteangense]|uniref:uncharacterized protein n=1 Tax=Annulohypoxylon maeteangense TaxID=1927788 RepID=UPI002007A243|nr:uncharacterized protein GGS22DRAFT_68882 [Annulohypoxylon maeteangense]KAI0889225.1 hypothetical protein GGS22DRAFT_68882 [Annulohypoxylon maeteangense]